MNREIADRWIARLRSGQDVQGAGCLHSALDGAKCCLGILTEIAVNDGVIEPGVRHRRSGFSARFYYANTTQNDIESAILPLDVLTWAGMNTATGILPFDLTGRVDEASLSYLNDEGFTFDQIADIIDYFAEWL